MSKKTKLITGALIVFAAVNILSYVNAKRKGSQAFDNFYNAEINGVVEEEVRASVSGTYFQVAGTEYNFLPYTADINSNTIFSRVAVPGDSIIKAQKSDTLILIKRGEVLLYTFKKLQD